MVWQTAEGLQAQSVGRSLGDELQKFRGQEPPLACLVARGDELSCAGKEILELCHLREGRACQGPAQGIAHVIELLDEVPAKEGRQGLAAQPLPAVDGIREAVQEEIHHIRENRLAAFLSCEIRDVAVGIRMVAEQDFAHYTHSRTLVLVHGNACELPGHGLHVCLEIAAFASREIPGYGIHPLFDQGVRVSLVDFVGVGVLREPLHHIAVEYGPEGIVEEIAREGEARLVGTGLAPECQGRHVVKACLLQGALQKTWIVGGSAGAAGLREQKCRMLRIHCAALQGVDKLAYDHLGRIAGVVVHVSETCLDILVRDSGQHMELVASSPKHAFRKGKVHWRHLRSYDGVGCPHVLCEHRRVQKIGICFLLPCLPALLPALLDGGEQGSYAYAGSTKGRALVDFQQGVHLACTMQDFCHLIRGDSVYAAAKGGELDQFQMLHGCHDPGCPIEP